MRFELNTIRRVTLDRFLVVGTALLLAGLLFGSFALTDKFHIGYKWNWAIWFGVSSFLIVGLKLRPKAKQRGFIAFCSAWFLVHMLIMIMAASRLPLLISTLPVVFELWLGLAIAYRLFGLPPKHKK